MPFDPTKPQLIVRMTSVQLKELLIKGQVDCSQELFEWGTQLVIPMEDVIVSLCERMEDNRGWVGSKVIGELPKLETQNGSASQIIDLND